MRHCPPPPAIAAALTIFDSQGVFRAELPGEGARVVLLRFRHGSRTVVLGKVMP